MPEERRCWAGLDDPGTELALTIGEPATDDEIDLLCELARSGTADIVPGRPFAVNEIAGIRGYQDVVLRDAAGGYRINPDIGSFAGEIFEHERRRRASSRATAALVRALEELPDDVAAALASLCWQPQPLEAAVAGVEVGDPERVAVAVNEAARRHGVSAPLVAASALTIRAVPPADLLVAAVLHKLQDDRTRIRRRRLAALVASLGPDETALLRHTAGVQILDAARLRALDQAGEVINERAAAAGIVPAAGPPVLISRDQRGRWRLDLGTRFDLLDILRE